MITERVVDKADRPRFIADSMLGSLARRLRMLGIDTAFLRDASDGELRFVVRSQERILLSRDCRLVKALGDRAWLVTGSDVREEFTSIASKLAEKGCGSAAMSRCLECNGRLAPVDPSSAGAKVPPHVLDQGLDLVSCPECGKAYWKGTHRERMDAEVRWMEEELEKRRRQVD